jgi:FkbM family methyltransferase
MRYERGDAVAKFLRQGWFESDEQAFLWLFLRDGDVVVDCGAHAGLFSVLAGKLVCPDGRVLSVEPSPATARLLRENLAEHGLAALSTVIESAAGAGRGTMTLVNEGEGKSAYNRLERDAAAATDGIPVPVDALESLLARAGVTRATFLKLDVEGAELDAWAGAKGLIDRGALPVVMVEFTEANLRRVGRSTEELHRTIEDSGYVLHRFDPATGQLVPRPFDGPIWYENLFAVRDAGAVNARLRDAPPERRRIAWDIVQRGIAGAAAREADERAREADARSREVDERSREAAALASELHEVRREYETSREQMDRLARQAADARAALDDARRTVARLSGEAAAAAAERDAARTRVAELGRQLAAQAQRLKDARQAAARDRERLHAFCVSKYDRLAWALHLRSKPKWVDELIARQNGRPAADTDVAAAGNGSGDHA